MRITALVLSVMLGLFSIFLTGCDGSAPDVSKQDAKVIWQPHLTDYTQGWVGAEVTRWQARSNWVSR
jgi:outer membrane biogenesis lipoprotein LolB